MSCQGSKNYLLKAPASCASKTICTPFGSHSFEQDTRPAMSIYQTINLRRTVPQSEWDPKIVKRGPNFEQKGDQKGTKRGPKRGPKNRGFKISKKAYMLKFSTKKSNLPSKFIERVHFHFHSPSTIQSNSDKHMYLDTAGYFHTICQMVHKG